ncbi:MAG: hypothetical protein FWG55_08620, partial [Candidatus Bathyarchaeota archaeon]|nr:hypothetical protein [Candidatus Termiticorpusculum sp.]
LLFSTLWALHNYSAYKRLNCFIILFTTLSELDSRIDKDLAEEDLYDAIDCACNDGAEETKMRY